MAVRTKNALHGPYWIGTEQQEGPLPKGLFPGSLPLTLVCIVALKGARQGRQPTPNKAHADRDPHGGAPQWQGKAYRPAAASRSHAAS